MWAWSSVLFFVLPGGVLTVGRSEPGPPFGFRETRRPSVEGRTRGFRVACRCGGPARRRARPVAQAGREVGTGRPAGERRRGCRGWRGGRTGSGDRGLEPVHRGTRRGRVMHRPAHRDLVGRPNCRGGG